MKKEEIKKILNIIFSKDLLEKQKKGKSLSEDIFFEESEIFLMILKSMILTEEEFGAVIDYNRLIKELETWKLYRHTNNEMLIKKLNEDYKEYNKNYFKELYIGSFAIIVSNENKKTVLKEILKMSFFFTGNIKLILQNYYESAILFNLLNGNSIEKTLMDSKQEIIRLSLKEEIEKYTKFLKYKENENYILEFEKARVKLIMEISNIEEDNFYIKDLKLGYILECFSEESKYADTVTSIGLYEYLFKLRKGRISIDSFKNNYENNIDYFSLEKGSIIRDPVFGRFQLLDIIQQDKYELRYIKTKIGKFRLFRKK